MSRALRDLAPDFRPLAVELLAQCAEAGIPVFIVDTLRTQEEHEKNLAAGRSWTKHSKHLVGQAIDICPYEVFQSHGPDKLLWNSEDPIWQKIGDIGVKLGLRWGGNWTKRDMGHFENKD